MFRIIAKHSLIMLISTSTANLAHLGGLQHLQALVDLGAAVVLAAVEDPRDAADDDDDGEDDDAVVHVGASDGQLGREDEEDAGDDDVSDAELWLGSFVSTTCCLVSERGGWERQ